MTEAAARIKINRLLEAASWRFFPEGRRGLVATHPDSQTVTAGRPPQPAAVHRRGVAGRSRCHSLTEQA